MLRFPQYGLLINWGCSKLDLKLFPGQEVLNEPESVAYAKCKLQTFRLFAANNVPHPPFYTPANIGTAKDWDILICRTTTRGSGGEGIVVVRKGQPIPNAPLYTKYIRKQAEYRIHVVRNQVIMIQQKRRDTEAEQTDDQKLIRNYDNGWVFAANNVEFKSNEQKANCERAAIAAVSSLGLDFGAVDLVVGSRDGLPYVLEVNTAPGLSSPTLIENYRRAFQKIQGETKYDASTAERVRVGRPRALGGTRG